MPQSKEVHAEYMRKYRGSQSQGSQTEVHSGSQDYPPIIEALADIKTRAKLRAICESLNAKKLLGEVRYGVNGVTMDVVAELLGALP